MNFRVAVRIDSSEWLAMLAASDLILTAKGLETPTDGPGNRTAARLEDPSDVQTLGAANRKAEAKGWE